MAIRPKPYKKICNKCGYFKIVRPKSDMVDESWEIGKKCPRCGSLDFKRKELNKLEKILFCAF